jgi:hypothetical protein
MNRAHRAARGKAFTLSTLSIFVQSNAAAAADDCHQRLRPVQARFQGVAGARVRARDRPQIALQYRAINAIHNDVLPGVAAAESFVGNFLAILKTMNVNRFGLRRVRNPPDELQYSSQQSRRQRFVSTAHIRRLRPDLSRMRYP